MNNAIPSWMTVGWGFFLVFSCQPDSLYISCPAPSDDYPRIAVGSELLPVFESESVRMAPDYNRLCHSRRDDLFENRFSPWSGGSESIDVVVEYFSSFRCPHSADFAQHWQQIQATHPEVSNRVRFYFHHLLSPHHSMYHAAAMAAGAQGMDNFFAMHDFLFANVRLSLPFSTLRDFARDQLHLDMAEFDRFTSGLHPEGEALYQWIERDGMTAGAFCAQGTPAVYVCGRQLLDWRDLATVLDQHFD